MQTNLSTITAFLLCCCLAIACSPRSSPGNLRVTSPDGTIEVVVDVASHQPRYSVGVNGSPIIAPSRLGMDASSVNGLPVDWRFAGSEHSHDVDSIRNAGRTALAVGEYNELRLHWKNTSNSLINLTIVFRIFNDGVAFRYDVAGDSFASVLIGREFTQFNLTGNPRCWYLDKATSDFEGFYSSSAFRDITADSTVHLPFTAQQESGVCVAISEAALTNHRGLRLRKDRSDTGVIQADPEYMTGRTSPVLPALPFVSPWRTIQVARTPAELIESSLILHLNEPSPLRDTNWIARGKAMWTWYANGTTMKNKRSGFTGMNTASIKKYVDEAAVLKCSYFVIDAGWAKGQEHDSIARNIHRVFESVDGLDLREVTRYASEKKISVLLWTNYATIRKENPDSVFRQFSDWGVKGAKVDFFCSDDEDMVLFVEQLAQTAAKYKMVLNLHSIYKPTGLERTWPNLLTYESVLGAEYNKWGKVTTEHNLILPFTRNLVGPMDYTPAGFNNASDEQHRVDYQFPQTVGTRAHHLAMYVVYFSPLQMISDDPSFIRSAEGESFVREVPTVWDETVALDGEIGKYVAVARRSGERWFLGAMTTEARELKIRFPFLKGKHRIQHYHDTNIDAGKGYPEFVDGETELSIPMTKDGGYTAILSPHGE